MEGQNGGAGPRSRYSPTDRLGCALAWKQSDALRVSPCGVVSVKISATRWNTGGATSQNTLGEARRRHRPAIRCEPIHTSVSSCYHEDGNLVEDDLRSKGTFFTKRYGLAESPTRHALLNWALSLLWP
jgi:hypothetical protein